MNFGFCASLNSPEHFFLLSLLWPGPVNSAGRHTDLHFLSSSTSSCTWPTDWQRQSLPCYRSKYRLSCLVSALHKVCNHGGSKKYLRMTRMLRPSPSLELVQFYWRNDLSLVCLMTRLIFRLIISVHCALHRFCLFTLNRELICLQIGSIKGFKCAKEL